jgi:ADP-heptose:LPS heptosyltransferase
MRVLALVPGGVSEQLLFFPTLEHLKHAFPKAEISVAVEPTAKAAYRVSALVKEVFPYDFKQRNSPSDWANLLGIIRDREFEVVITATQSWSLGLLLWLSGVPTRVGYGNGANDLCLTDTVPYKTAQYKGWQYHDLLKGLSIGGPCPNTVINVPQKDLDWVNGQINGQGIGDQGYVLMYGGSTDDGQPYPADSWAEIIQDFQARQPGLPLVLMQQPETAELVQNLTQRLPNLNVVRPDNVGQVAALIAGANLMLSTDSYPLQLGVALNVFTLALLGANPVEQRLPALTGSETRFIGLTSPTGKVADITAKTVLGKVWGEA